MAQRDQIKRALRRQFADQGIESAFAQDLIDGANPIRPLGMSGRGQMVEGRGVAQQKRRHATPFICGWWRMWMVALFANGLIEFNVEVDPGAGKSTFTST